MEQAKGKSLFVAGTDTDIGKTFICTLLLRYLREQQVEAGYQKWVSTGGAEPQDLLTCLQGAGVDYSLALLDLLVPYRFGYPASPHYAAELEGREIDPDHILRQFEELRERYELLVVEGVGGLCVPLRRDLLLIDLLARQPMPTLLVAKSGLGTLNHTLLSLEALRQRRIPVLGVVCTDNEPGLDGELVADNLRTIGEMGQVTVFGRVRWSPLAEACAGFGEIGGRILQQLR